jgi:hypothetical protein
MKIGQWIRILKATPGTLPGEAPKYTTTPDFIVPFPLDLQSLLEQPQKQGSATTVVTATKTMCFCLTGHTYS